MPEFATPEPISVVLAAVTANTTIIAGDRADTVVEVRPTNESNASDVRAAGAVRVTYADGQLLVKGARRSSIFSSKSESFDVHIELPAGSAVDADVTSGGFTAEGRLGRCRFKTYDGGAHFEETGPVQVSLGMGRVSVARASGDVDVSTGTGDVRLGEVEGSAVVKNLNGSTRIGRITGELRVNSANGDTVVERAGSGVHVRSAKGGVRIDEVSRGVVDLDVASGDLEVGIREGTAAWLDVNSVSGRVHNRMTPTDHAPEPGEVAEVRARTIAGDIVVHRADIR
ncbi:DUF4097 family beta strand repeat-containing protein [Actinophytocola xanthii]|uniref:DUF4097 domain-containing protein n=1 Tax=Actinophytocola xanthii TaxID=1912961 RepID=A0A1Q8CLC5_9PSEU|nr:DUF4097 family beta strand repeat-containing protein [Actinophytocola xanthii]OLF15153.1 hypothetical protein BU204_23060 [Actinophytocola xanthii]